MEPVKTLSYEGNVRQASLINAYNDLYLHKVTDGLRHGTIANVYTIDNPNKRGIPYGKYTLYDVRLAPTGQIMHNVPSILFGGHYTESDFAPFNKLPNFSVNSDVSSPEDTIQNVEETPYVLNQPVLIGFIYGHELNPIILGPVSCIRGGFGQTTAEYPKKFGHFQGTSWSVDKNGSVELDVPTAQTITIKVNGLVFCKIKNGEVDLGGDSGLESTILGDTFKTYLDNLKSWMDRHTHDYTTPLHPSITAPTAQPAASPSIPDINTDIVKVK